MHVLIDESRRQHRRGSQAGAANKLRSSAQIAQELGVSARWPKLERLHPDERDTPEESGDETKEEAVGELKSETHSAPESGGDSPAPCHP